MVFSDLEDIYSKKKGNFIYNAIQERGTQMTKLYAIEYESFETIKQIDENKVEF